MNALKIYFDGGCRPNPGMIEVAAVVRGVAHVRRDVGLGSSFDAEWLALAHAVGIAAALGESNFVLLGDCAGVAAQANGSARCGSAALAHRARIMAMLPPGTRLRVRHIKRTQNLAGIALARLHDR